MRPLPGLAALALFTMGCSAAGDGHSKLRPPLTLSPSAELADATEAAAAAWEHATGIEMVVGSGGVPLWVEDDIDACGKTFTRRRASTLELVGPAGIAVRRRAPAGKYCRDWTGTLKHELGHLLSELGSPDSPVPNGGHTETGLMSEQAIPLAAIDEPALQLVCSYAHCIQFEPERQNTL